MAYLGILGHPQAWSDAERGEVIEQAIRHQLVNLFDALVVAAYGAMLEGRVVATSAAEHLLWIAGGVVRKEALYGARDSREFLDIILRCWRKAAPEIRRGMSPEVEAWVEGYVGDLEKQAGTRCGA